MFVQARLVCLLAARNLHSLDPQDRVTDHRVGLTLHGLGELMSGEGEAGGGSPLDSIIDALALAEQVRQLELICEGEA